MSIANEAQKRGTYGEVGGELSPHNTIGSMGAGDLSPHDTELGSSLGGLGSVNVSNFLSQIKINGRLVVATINSQKIGVVVCVAATSTYTFNINIYLYVKQTS
jgi:hypothetical protein